MPPCPAICKSGGTCSPVFYGVGATGCGYILVRFLIDHNVCLCCSMRHHLSRHLRAVRLLQRDHARSRRRLHPHLPHALRDGHRARQLVAASAFGRRQPGGIFVGGLQRQRRARPQRVQRSPSTAAGPRHPGRRAALSMAQYLIRLRFQRRYASMNSVMPSAQRNETETKLKQNSFKTVLKLLCVSFISSCERHYPFFRHTFYEGIPLDYNSIRKLLHVPSPIISVSDGGFVNAKLKQNLFTFFYCIILGYPFYGNT